MASETHQWYARTFTCLRYPPIQSAEEMLVQSISLVPNSETKVRRSCVRRGVEWRLRSPARDRQIGSGIVVGISKKILHLSRLGSEVMAVAYVGCGGAVWSLVKDGGGACYAVNEGVYVSNNEPSISSLCQDVSKGADWQRPSVIGDILTDEAASGTTMKNSGLRTSTSNEYSTNI